MEGSPNQGSMVLLTRLAKVVYRRSSEELLGMRLRRFVTLSYLRDHGRVPQQQMCEMLSMDANNLVLLLNELEAAGHVTRWRDPGDRRRHIVELTAAGRAALERAERAQESIEDEVLAALDAAGARNPPRPPAARSRRRRAAPGRRGAVDVRDRSAGFRLSVATGARPGDGAASAAISPSVRRRRPPLPITRVAWSPRWQA